MNKPPRLGWENGHTDHYLIQSSIIRGEPRVYYAVQKGGGRWQGPSRVTQRAAEIDAEYHAAGFFEKRPVVRAYTF